MKTLIISLVLVGLMAGTACADFDTKPNLIFNPDTCMLRITPQDGVLLEGWYICVYDRAYIDALHESEGIACDQLLEINEHYSIDMTPYLDNCSTAVPDQHIDFGTIKSYYK